MTQKEEEDSILAEMLQVLKRIEKHIELKDHERKSRYVYCLDADAAAAETILKGLNISHKSGRAPLNAAAAVAEYVISCSEDQFTALQAKLLEDLPAAVAVRERPPVVLPVK